MFIEKIQLIFVVYCSNFIAILGIISKVFLAEFCLEGGLFCSTFSSVPVFF